MTKVSNKIGKGNSLLYALVVCAFLTWQTISISYSKEEGWTFKTQNVPLGVLTPCLVFMAAALGINLKEEIALIAAAVSRNSAAITALAAATIEQSHQQATATEEATKIIEEIDSNLNKKDSDY